MAFDWNKGTPVSNTGKQITKKPKSGLEKTGDWFEKYVLDPLSSFTGADKLTEMMEPIAEYGLTQTPLLSKETRQKLLLTQQPASTSAAVAEKEGLGAGIKTIAGQGASTAASMMPFGKGMTSAVGNTVKGKMLNFGAKGSLVGSFAEIGEKLENGEQLDGTFVGGVIKEAGKDFVTSALMQGVIDKMGTYFEKKATRLYGMTFKPSIKSLQSDIEKDYKTINTAMANEGYWGSAESIKSTAKENLKKYGAEIGAITDKAEGTVYKKDVVTGLEKLFDKNDVLTDSELNMIVRQINMLPETMTVAEANKWKQEFAERVSSSAWDDLATKADSFRNKIYKTVSGSLRSEVERFAPEVRKVNEKWSIALDTLSLASKVIGQAENAPGIADRSRGGFINLIVSLPIIQQLYGVTARTARGQIYQNLSKLSKDELVQVLERLMVQKKIQ